MDGIARAPSATETKEEFANNNHTKATATTQQESNSDGYEAPSELPAQAFARALYPFKGEFPIPAKLDILSTEYNSNSELSAHECSRTYWFNIDDGERIV